MQKHHMRLKTKDGFDLDTVFTEVEGTKRVVVLAHGLTVSKEDESVFTDAEMMLNHAGFSTVRFDFRCHGKSSGTPEKDFNITGELIDLETVIEMVRGKDYTWIGLAGASFGGGTSALYTASHMEEIKALCLVNPVLNYQNAYLNPTTEWRRRSFANAIEQIESEGYFEIGSRNFKAGKPLFDDMKEYTPDTELEKYQGPLLIVHGDADSKIPHQEIYNIFIGLSNSNKELEIIKGAEHGFHEDPYRTQAAELIADFFVESVA